MADAQSVQATELAGSAPADMSMLGLFLQADIVVKLVMLVLISVSVWSWAIIFSKRSALKKLNKRADRFEDAFMSGESLDKLYERVRKTEGDPLLATFTTGMEEWQNASASGLPVSENLRSSLKERLERVMTLRVSREMQRLEKGMTFLASVGATAPFIGLFGTVWGIMNSFAAIAQTKNTSLAVVAPGIAEALFATALGLVAAIPAVIAYNVFTSELARYAERLEGFISDFTTLIARYLDDSGSRRATTSTTTAA
jgi:biopolymer transport protein TolQ